MRGAMRAVSVNGFGEPDVLVIEEVPDPEPAAGQVLVDVRMAGVAYGDVIVRSGAQAVRASPCRCSFAGPTAISPSS